jgi:hypothetical protein
LLGFPGFACEAVMSSLNVHMAVSAGGAIKSVKTIPLLTFDEGLQAMSKAKGAEYTPPATEIPYFGTYRPAA